MSKKTDYEKLKEIWYKKLSRHKDEDYPDGFIDIEKDENRLKEYSSWTFAPKRALFQNGGWKAKAAYYSMAERFLQDYPFDTSTREGRREQVIWEYHANAISARDIAKIFRKLRWVQANRTHVWEVINKLRKKMFELYSHDGKEYHE